MVPHLVKCVLVAPDVKDKAELESTGKKSGTRTRTLSHSASWSHGLRPSTITTSLAPPVAGTLSSASISPLPSPALPSVPFLYEPVAKRRRTSSIYEDSPTLGMITHQWTPSLQQEFGEDFCRLLVATRSAWNFANNPQTHLFAQKWMAGAVVPDRRTLSGPILDREAAKVEDKLKFKLKGKLAMFQTDGWKNKAKQSIVATMATVGSEVRLCHVVVHIVKVLI
jgi:hypothetical protein